MKKIVLLALFLISPMAGAATCIVSQYDQITTDEKGREPQVAKEPGVVVPQVLTFTSTSTPSAEFDAHTTFVGIICTAKTHYEFGAAPVAATTENAWLPADVMVFFGVRSTGLKVAFVEGV